ncbi:MAG: RimK/LysX family protein [Hyphomicrobiaceae bacterium]
MTEPYIIGWEEWLDLPDLGVPAIKAKVDTGARTSALHAHLIEPFGPVDAPLVRFAVHPIAGRTDVEITCSAPIIDRREVTSSNGERETRYVIRTKVRMGPRTWPIEVTLTNRETMTYRMLLGRQAIQDDMFIDPASSFRQPKLSYKLYKHMPRRAPVKRALRIAILTDTANAQNTTRIATAAYARGHVVETLIADELALAFDNLIPSLTLGETALGHFDFVMPHFDIASQPFALHVLRQLELMGSTPLNSASALATLTDPVAVRQLLMASRIPMLGPDRIESTTVVEPPFSSSQLPSTRVLVVGHSAVAAIHMQAGRGVAPVLPPIDRVIQRMAHNTARVLKLRLVSIDFTLADGANYVTAIDAMPRLSEFLIQTGLVAAPLIVTEAELQSRSWARHRSSDTDTQLANSDGG